MGAIGRARVFGPELFGAIELGPGRKAAFAATQEPRRQFEPYHRALGTDPGRLNAGIRIPDRAVTQGFAIGPRR